MGTALAMLVYVIVTAVLFGGPLHPIALATMWSNRLGAPYWPLIALLMIAASALVFIGSRRSGFDAELRLPIFVALAVILPTVTVGIYADWLRSAAIRAFEPDEVVDHSFLQSLHESPREFQSFLHSAVLKECTPYTWSYRTMSFHVMSPNIGANVLPRPWIERCNIRRNTK